jgi:hypothetical protein
MLVNVFAPSKRDLILEHPETNPVNKYKNIHMDSNAYWGAIYMAYRTKNGANAWDVYANEMRDRESKLR